MQQRASKPKGKAGVHSQRWSLNYSQSFHFDEGRIKIDTF